ncbi:MAG: phosphoribosylamine--glycine ligase, partial [Dehalococcoidia bacterium]|nr:phosphoribosylamine--glycine ligase [Dehalococcoidia bacterium]
MKVLVVGNGAREHAIAWKIRQSPLVDELFVAPGNAGTAAIATNIPVSATDIEEQMKVAIQHGIDLTVVGPEAPLAAGIVDRFQEQDLPVFGPTKGAARIESSKVFAKELMAKHGIPTGRYAVFDSYGEACSYVKSQALPVVVKADGLAAGKGVAVAKTEEEAVKALQECLVERVFGVSGDWVLVEECLAGPEVSVFAFTDGETLSPLVTACDYKRAFDRDEGPNTGGMGSYSPPPFWSLEMEQEVREKIMEPTVRALAQEGCPFRGVLYGGLMLTEDGPKVIEFNCRLGDPETQVILPRLKEDLVEIIVSVVNGMLNKTSIAWSDEACVGVVMVPGGYPGSYATGMAISGLDEANTKGLVLHAGTRQEGLVTITDGGRTLTVVGKGRNLEEARSQAYEGISHIQLEGGFFRRDIAAGI